jgi:ribonuclease HI
MKFSPTKTKVIIFSKKPVDTRNLTKLKLYGIPIDYSTSAKYLGVTFDKKLNFKEHIEQKFKATKKLLFATRNAIGKFWGPKPKLIKWAYTSMVRPIFTYGAIAWAKATRTKTFEKRAKRLQRLALKSMGPIRTHSPTSAIEIFTYVPPLEIFIKGELIAAYKRIKPYVSVDPALANADLTESHLAWAEKLSEQAGVEHIPEDSIPPFFHWSRAWQYDREEYDLMLKSKPDRLQVYTDGSRTLQNKELTTGCGFVVKEYVELFLEYHTCYEASFYLGSYASVFQAEVHAIEKAVEHVQNNLQKYVGHGIKAIDIISDSKSALQGLCKNVVRNGSLKNCKIKLDELQARVPITLHWIRAHRGHEGNEEADRAAKKGTMLREFDVEPILPVPKTWTKRKIAKYIEARQMKLFFPTPDWKKAKELIELNREEYAKIFRWASGHSFHRYHNHVTNSEKFPSPLCRVCGQDREETSHLYAYCYGLNNIRVRTLGVISFGTKIEWTGRQLLAMARKTEELCPEEVPGDATGTQATQNNPQELTP